LLDYENVRGIHIPREVQTGTRRFIGVGKVLAVSDHLSDDEQVEKMKAVLRESKYVGFEFHVVAEVVMIPQLELPRDVSLLCMHVKDVVYIPRDLDELLEKQVAHEKAELLKDPKRIV
jgi:hypothetical protein